MELRRFVSGRHLPVVLQAEQSECGLACLAMVLNFHGHRIDINTLRARLGASQQGMTLKALMLLADRLELGARPLRLEADELGKLPIEDPISVPDAHATIYSAMGIRPEKILYDGDRPVPITDMGVAVKQAFA